MPISFLQLSADRAAPAQPPPEEPRSAFRWPIVLAVLALIIGGALFFAPLARIKTAVAAVTTTMPSASRTLTIHPGLVITCNGGVPIQFTAARVHAAGKAVPCLRGWLGVTSGDLSDHPGPGADADPFKDSSLRLRFTVGKPGPKALTLSSNEGDPNALELDKSDAVTEYTYTGGAVRLELTVQHGRVVLASAAP